MLILICFYIFLIYSRWTHKVHSDSIVNNTQGRRAQKWISNWGRPKNSVNPIKADTARLDLHTLISYFQLLILIGMRQIMPRGLGSMWWEAASHRGERCANCACVRARYSNSNRNFPHRRYQKVKGSSGRGANEDKAGEENLFNFCPWVRLSDALMLRDSAKFNGNNYLRTSRWQIPVLSANEWKVFMIHILLFFMATLFH